MNEDRVTDRDLFISEGTIVLHTSYPLTRHSKLAVYRGLLTVGS